MHTHGFNTMNEQDIETVFNQINDRELYNQTLDKFKDVDAEYRKYKDNEQYDKNALAELKKQRTKLCNIIISTRSRLIHRDINVFSKK
jgi:hypothetical protein